MAERDASLFREEVVAELRDNGYGQIRVAQPLSAWVVSITALSLGMLLIVFVVHGEVEKKSAVFGITQPIGGSLAVVAHSGGVLESQFAAEGELVKAGQALFEISTARRTHDGELTGLIAQQIEARKESLKAERHNRKSQDSEKRAAISERLKNLQFEEIGLSNEIELAKRRRVLGQKSLDQYLSLEKLHFASATQRQEKQEILLDLDGRVSALVRANLQLQANRIALETESKEVGRRSAADMLQMDRAEASLQQEIAENRNRRSSIISAPADGTLTSITYRPGQGILNGQVLATLLPHVQHSPSTSDLEVHLFVPSRTAGFIEKGQRVFLRYQAFAYQKFGLQRGVVTQVGEAPFAPNELPSSIASTILGNLQQNGSGPAGNEALYRITVRPDFQYVGAYGRRHHLKPGMSLTADVVQEKRFIWEWIIDPIRALQMPLRTAN